MVRLYGRTAALRHRIVLHRSGVRHRHRRLGNVSDRTLFKHGHPVRKLHRHGEFRDHPHRPAAEGQDRHRHAVQRRHHRQDRGFLASDVRLSASGTDASGRTALSCVRSAAERFRQLPLHEACAGLRSPGYADGDPGKAFPEGEHRHRPFLHGAMRFLCRRAAWCSLWMGHSVRDGHHVVYHAGGL